MSAFDCPKCNVEYSTNDHPDHLRDMTDNSFIFECDCGCEFKVMVDWEPECWVDMRSIRIKESLSVTKEPEMEQAVQSSTKAAPAEKSQ